MARYDKKALTQADAERMTGKSPQDKDFAASANTIQVYQKTSQTLAALNQQISNMYGPSDKWNPQAVIETIKRYSEVINGVIDQSKDLIEADPNLGPLFGNFLADRSRLVSTYKTGALRWLNYMQDSNVYNKAQAEATEESAKKMVEIAGMQKEALGQQIPAVASLLELLKGINE